MDFAAQYETALSYNDFLKKYATDEQNRRWGEFYESVSLTDEQISLLESFTREMKVLVMAGAWCGDCVNQCPIFQRFSESNSNIQIRFADRDDSPALSAELKTCGGARVPAIVFLSEDGQFCGRAGDRTLSKYRSVVSQLEGATCPTGLAVDNELTKTVIQDWLNEFERIQWMLRTSSRLREIHND